MDDSRRSRGGDSYHPPPRPPRNPLPPRPPRTRERGVSPEDPPAFRFGQSSRSDHDSYGRHDFEFRSATESRPRFPLAPVVPQNTLQASGGVSRGRNDARQPYRGSWGGRGGNRNQRGRGGRGGRGNQGTASRPLLQGRRSPTPDQFSGMAQAEARFKDPNNLSDSQEEDMELDSEDDQNVNAIAIQSDTSNAPAHQASLTTAEETEKPRWSNPDPYTSLPAPEEARGKRKDVLSFIRKARTTNRDTQPSAPQGSADFISFETDNTDAHPTNTSEKPISGHKRKFDQAEESSLKESTPEGLVPKPRDGKKKKKRFEDGRVKLEWQGVHVEDASPWLPKDANFEEDAMLQLDSEIKLFYEFVQPRDFENEMREDLMERLGRFVEANYRDCRAKCFGSFAAGLFLPEGDMDVVVVSRSYQHSKRPRVMQRNADLHSFASKLKAADIAHTDPSKKPLVITRAKVPVVKFIDRKTELRVDVSFENTTGLEAIPIYKQWMTEHPKMPQLVSLIKQFLLMRGLNEVQYGGLGGFSVSCMVVSHLQHTLAEQSLAECFLGFLNYYGNRFDYTNNAIMFDPPGVFPKSHCYDIRFHKDKPGQFCIVDPKNRSNNISGGSYQIAVIRQAFSDAYERIMECIQDYNSSETSDLMDGILGQVFAGNYEKFTTQRAHLKRLFRLEF